MAFRAERAEEDGPFGRVAPRRVERPVEESQRSVEILGFAAGEGDDRRGCHRCGADERARRFPLFLGEERLHRLHDVDEIAAVAGTAGGALCLANPTKEAELLVARPAGADATQRIRHVDPLGARPSLLHLREELLDRAVGGEVGEEDREAAIGGAVAARKVGEERFLGVGDFLGIGLDGGDREELQRAESREARLARALAFRIPSARENASFQSARSGAAQ